MRSSMNFGGSDGFILFFFFFLSISIQAGCSSSAIFLDSPTNPYLRPSTNVNHGPLSPIEAGAAASVLLGLAPPASLPAESSTKLGEILLPNPFDRPSAVFMLEAGGIGDPSPFLDHAQVGAAAISKRLVGSEKAQIDVPDEGQVSLALLDEMAQDEVDLNEKKLNDFAKWLGGSYVGALDAMDWELTLPLENGKFLNLHMSKKADRDFAINLASLVYNVRLVGEMHEAFSERVPYQAELLTGSFTGIQALLEQYGPGGIVDQGTEIFLTVVTKLFDSLQSAYQGKIVGVLILNEKSSLDSGLMLNVKLSTRVSRWLEEEGSQSTTAAEVALVRRTLAWTTAFIVLVALLIGIYMLFNMPLTRDTLLYSNVKLD